MTAQLPWWHRLLGSPDMASCREVARVLQSYLDGQVDELTTRRVARHLEMCRRCGLEAETYVEIKRALARRSGELDPAAVARLREFGARLIEDSGEAPPRTGL